MAAKLINAHSQSPREKNLALGCKVHYIFLSINKEWCSQVTSFSQLVIGYHRCGQND